MQIPYRYSLRHQSGYALTITLTFLLVTLIVFASIMYWVSSSVRVSQQNNLFNISQAAAQGAIEVTLAQMDRDFIYQTINSSSSYIPLAANIDQSSWPVKFIFSDTNGHPNQIYVDIYPQDWSTNFISDLGSQFAGLYGYAAQCTLVAMATPTNAGYNMASVVQETANLAAIPIFQFGVFYNLDLDFSPGQSLTMNGKVHVNGTMWMCPQADAYFNDVVEATAVVTNKDNPNDQQNLTYNASYRHVVALPGGNPRSGVDPLTIPVSGGVTNVEAILNLPPAAVAAPNAAAYYTSNQVFLYNRCDLIISNSINGTNGARGTNITIFYQDKNRTPSFVLLTNNGVCTISNRSGHMTFNTNNPNLPSPATNFILVSSFFPFVTNVTFYDFREQKQVQAVQIDIGALSNWLVNPLLEGSNWNRYCGGANGMERTPASDTGTKGHPIDTIFVYNSVPLTATTLPAVRVVNGSILPTHWGLTIATPMPLYTLGNYNIRTNTSGSQSVLTTNTTWTKPAALMGDSITILSGNWNDSWNSGTSLGTRGAVSTTINAACLEGIVPSIKVGGTKHYSGGLENFLRLLESWSGDTLCYNGSIVVMFPSIYATNFWIGPGTYYNVPTRQWGFDANFKTPDGSPPGVPSAKGVIRGNWSTLGH